MAGCLQPLIKGVICQNFKLHSKQKKVQAAKVLILPEGDNDSKNQYLNTNPRPR